MRQRKNRNMKTTDYLTAAEVAAAQALPNGLHARSKQRLADRRQRRRLGRIPANLLPAAGREQYE